MKTYEWTKGDSTIEFTEEYWSCECDKGYVHHSSVYKCEECGCYRDVWRDTVVEEMSQLDALSEDAESHYRIDVILDAIENRSPEAFTSALLGIARKLTVELKLGLSSDIYSKHEYHTNAKSEILDYSFVDDTLVNTECAKWLKTVQANSIREGNAKVLTMRDCDGEELWQAVPPPALIKPNKPI